MKCVCVQAKMVTKGTSVLKSFFLEKYPLNVVVVESLAQWISKKQRTNHTRYSSSHATFDPHLDFMLTFGH